MYKFFKHSMLIGIIGAAVNLFLFLTNLFYKLVVPANENSGIEGQTFKFLDDLIYYTPVIFLVLFVAYLIAGQIYLKKHHVEHENKLNEKNDEKNEKIQKDLDEQAEYLRHDYYTNCPKCGAARAENTTVCSFCGTSLIVKRKIKDT